MSRTPKQVELRFASVVASLTAQLENLAFDFRRSTEANMDFVDAIRMAQDNPQARAAADEYTKLIRRIKNE